MSALVCGLDVHKESTYATILDANGKIVNQKRMSNSLVSSYISSFKIDKIGMESSNQIVPLYRQLTKDGYTVSVSHPKKTRYIAEAKIKSDRIDSKAIAELVRLDGVFVEEDRKEIGGSRSVGWLERDVRRSQS